MKPVFNMNSSTEVKFCLSLPSDRVLSSGAVTFPGAFDQLGSPVVIFPAETQNKLLSEVTKEEAVEFIYYCLRIHKSRSECLVSVVADLREASLGVTRRVAEILLLLELHKRSVQSFYVVLPKKRDVQKLLQKLLSPSKRSSTTFTCVYLKEVFELCKYVDRSQLTANLGGYFIYSHESWVSFVQMMQQHMIPQFVPSLKETALITAIEHEHEMDSFVQEFVAVVRKLPVCIAALQDFSELAVPTEYESLALFCSSNQARLQQLRRELGLDALLRRCECVLEKFRYPERDQCYQAMVGTVLFTHTALEMLQNYDRIKAAVEKVDVLWRRVFSGARLQLHILQLQRDSGQVMNQMDGLLRTLGRNKSETLRDGGRSETLRADFKSSVYTRATMLTRRAEALIRAVTETPALSDKPDWTKDLENRTESFRSALELHHSTLNTVCSFHRCYHQIRAWYEAAVSERFLQDLLWIACADKPHEDRRHVSSAIERFLRFQPPPETDELAQLVRLADMVPDAYLESAGRRLAHRCTGLRKLLTSPGSASFRDLQVALQWQYECLKGGNEPADVLANGAAKDSGLVSDGDVKGFVRRDVARDRPLIKLPSLSSFDSGFDGAGGGHVETSAPRLRVGEENVSPQASIRISDSLNLAITVKRSATLPKNPWLSLPVDDLENCYTVIISPGSDQQGVMQSCDRLTQTRLKVCDQDQNADWSPICDALSSTLTDVGGGAEQSEAAPTLLWDSYDLHDLTRQSSERVPVCDWELKEQQELSAVEESLNRAATILQEEESVLAQEEILDALLKADHPDRLWPSWNCDLTQMSSGDLAEAGVIGLEDVPVPSLGPGTDVPDRADLLTELKILRDLDDKIAEENLKIDELRHLESEDGSAMTAASQERARFREELEREKREVEEMERSLSGETKKSKPKRPGRGRKIVTCSVMKKFDNDEDLISCRRSTPEKEPPEAPPPLVANEPLLEKLLDLKIGPDACDIHVDLPETSEEASSTPPFDPGGPKPFPRLSRPHPQSSDVSEGAPQPSSDLSEHLAPSAVPKPKERRNPPLGANGHLEHRNNNNNNLHAAAASDGLLEKSLEAELHRIDCAETETSPISSAATPLESSEKNEAGVCYGDAVTRSFSRSPVQLQICTRGMSGFQTPLVLDTGSGLVKAGFSDQDLPTTIFPTAIGLPKYEEVMSGGTDRSVYVGHDAQHMRGVLTLHYPMKNGLVCDWDQMELIWQHAFDQLRVTPEDHPVLLTEGAMNTLENRQRSVQVMFESFGVPLTYSALQPVLALYATGRTTGVALDSGDGVSHSVPVYDGYCLPHAVQRFNLAGADVTLHLKQLLLEQGVCMRTSAELEIVREMKEKCCRVALDYEAELAGGGGASAPAQYTLPDGQVVSLTTERFRAPEILFKPELIGQDYYGMHESVFKSVLQSDIDLRTDLVGNVVLSGGNTLLPGLPERLRHEISHLCPSGLGPRVRVTSPEDRDFLAWRGGAVLASMASFCSVWIGRDEYEEFGPQIVFRKCF